MVDSYLHGAGSVIEARFVLAAPFFAGFLFTGVLGLLGAWRCFGVARKVAVGLGMALFSFFGFEVLLFTVTEGVGV